MSKSWLTADAPATLQCHWVSLTTSTFPRISCPRRVPCASCTTPHASHTHTDAVSPSDHAEQAWFWLFEASPEVAADPLLSSPDVRMYLDAGELIRLAVEDDIFEEPEPGPVQSAAVGGPGPPGANASIVTEGDETKKTSPYRITVSCSAGTRTGSVLTRANRGQ